MADLKRPLPHEIASDCAIGFGVDTAAGVIHMQFDRHVRCVGLNENQAIELVNALVKGLQALGVNVHTGAGPGEQTH